MIPASDNNRDLYFRRFCGPGNLTMMECAGLVDSAKHRKDTVAEKGESNGNLFRKAQEGYFREVWENQPPL